MHLSHENIVFNTRSELSKGNGENLDTHYLWWSIIVSVSEFHGHKNVRTTNL